MDRPCSQKTLKQESTQHSQDGSGLEADGLEDHRQPVEDLPCMKYHN